MKSVSPTAVRHAAAMREDAVRPGQVTTGTPIQSASNVVIPPPWGNGSSAMSMSCNAAKCPARPRVIEKGHAVGGDALRGEHGQHGRLLACFIEQAVLEHQARLRQRAQDLGPGAQHGIEHLRQPIERAEGDVTARAAPAAARAPAAGREPSRRWCRAGRRSDQRTARVPPAAPARDRRADSRSLRGRCRSAHPRRSTGWERACGRMRAAGCPACVPPARPGCRCRRNGSIRQAAHRRDRRCGAMWPRKREELRVRSSSWRVSE